MSEKALLASLMQMYIKGVSTRKVKEITEKLCGTSFSKSRVIRIFPDERAFFRLIFALCIEQNEEWQAGRRYKSVNLFTREKMRSLKLSLERR